MHKPPLLSVVITVYQGEFLLDDTFSEIVNWEKSLPGGTQIEIIAVDDGSNDGSYAKILANQQRLPGKIRAIRLARNYGANAAFLAGIDVTKGDCSAVLPQDLQEPLEVLLRMFLAWQTGVKININFRQSRTEPTLKKSLPMRTTPFLDGWWCRIIRVAVWEHG